MFYALVLRLLVQNLAALARVAHPPGRCSGTFHPVSNPGSHAAGSQQHYIRDRDGTLPLRDASLDLARGVRTGMPFHHSHTLDQYLTLDAVDVEHAAGLTLVLTR